VEESSKKEGAEDEVVCVAVSHEAMRKISTVIGGYKQIDEIMMILALDNIQLQYSNPDDFHFVRADGTDQLTIFKFAHRLHEVFKVAEVMN